MELSSIQDTKNFSEKISKIIKKGDIIFLYGEIGVGKTTFVRFFINSLESENKIQNSEVLSPTFNIVYDYDVGKEKILHYDLYRLKNYNDILELGIFIRDSIIYYQTLNLKGSTSTRLSNKHPPHWAKPFFSRKPSLQFPTNTAQKMVNCCLPFISSL